MIARVARPEDAGTVIELAASMYQDMGLDAEHPVWRANAERMIRERNGDDDCAVFVTDEDGRVAACGGVTTTTRLPGPGNPSARYGYIQWMVTDPAFRKRGHARAVFEAILAWLRERGINNVELHATELGEPLYRAYGFGDPRYPQLRARLEW
jgi:GNAT superfamily N-acetyltransferase